jgi:creatinine amidohydrolase
MGDAPTIHELGMMTSPEVEAALPEIGCVVIPVGSCECHGPNIALASDAGQATAYGRLIVERMHPLLALAPTLSYGLSEHHMHFAGSTTLSPETFMNLCIEVATNFARHGVGRFFFMNGHGGNEAALQLVCDELYEGRGLRAGWATCGQLGALEQAEKLYQGFDVGHACEFETSSALYLCPELVRESALARGDFVPSPVRHARGLNSQIHYAYYWEERTRNAVLGDAPAAASVEHGREITERGLQMLSEFLEDFCALAVPAHSDRRSAEPPRG